MNAAALTLVNDSVIIDELTREEAIELVKEARDLPMEGLHVVIGNETIAVPPGLTGLLIHVVKHAAQGGVLTVRTTPEEVSTTVAAEMLGISRPTLMKLIASGVFAARQVGSHKRLKSVDVLRYRSSKLDAQKAAFGEIREMNL